MECVILVIVILSCISCMGEYLMYDVKVSGEKYLE